MTFSGPRKSTLSLLLGALGVCGLTSGPAMAQGGATGEMAGTVLDPSGGGTCFQCSCVYRRGEPCGLWANNLDGK
jgi:hypothetical protein